MRYKKFDYTKLTPPCLALVKNLKFEDDENGIGRIEFGDIIKVSKLRSELSDLTPDPKPIKTKKQLKRLVFRQGLIDMLFDYETLEEVDKCQLWEHFWDVDFTQSIEKIIPELFKKNPIFFNTSFNQFFEQFKIKDRDIFNESYVVGFFAATKYEDNLNYLKSVAHSLLVQGHTTSKTMNYIHYYYLEEMLEGEWNDEIDVQEMFAQLHEDLPKIINEIEKLPDDYDYLWDK